MANNKQNSTDVKSGTNKKVNIDGNDYDLDLLSTKAKSLIGFVQRLDNEIIEMRFQLDKSALARKQAILNLKVELD